MNRQLTLIVVERDSGKWDVELDSKRHLVEEEVVHMKRELEHEQGQRRLLEERASKMVACKERNRERMGRKVQHDFERMVMNGNQGSSKMNLIVQGLVIDHFPQS